MVGMSASDPKRTYKWRQLISALDPLTGPRRPTFCALILDGTRRMQFDKSTRQRFIKLLGSVAVIASLVAACTQQTAMPAVEFKGATTPSDVVNNPDSLFQEARVLGAPMAAVERAVQISRQPIFPKKDALAVFDISQPSAKKRFYVLDFKSGQVTAHYAAHGRDNGPQAKAVKFKASRRIWTWCHWAPLRQLIPRSWIPIRRL